MPLDDRKRSEHLQSILASFVLAKDKLSLVDTLNGPAATATDDFVERTFPKFIKPVFEFTTILYFYNIYFYIKVNFCNF